MENIFHRPLDLMRLTMLTRDTISLLQSVSNGQRSRQQIDGKRIGLLVVLHERVWNPSSGILIPSIWKLEDRDALLLGEWENWQWSRRRVPHRRRARVVGTCVSGGCVSQCSPSGGSEGWPHFRALCPAIRTQ